MKNTIKSLVLIILAMLIGFSMAACGDDSGDDSSPDPFSKTWLGPDRKMVASNGSWNQYLIPGNKEVMRGTYTYSGNTVIAKIIDVNTFNFGGADAWVTYANLSDTYKGYIGGTDTITLTITNNSFSNGGMTFIVSPNFNGSWTHSANIPGVGAVTITNVISGSNVTIKMNGADFQKGTFAFSSEMIYMKVTHVWEDGAWEPAGWDEDVTFDYTLTGNTFTLSNGLVDGEEPTTEKGENLPFFEGTWTRQ